MPSMKPTHFGMMKTGPLLIGLTVLSACSLKTPPDTEALRQQQVPAMAGRAAWVAPSPAVVAAVNDGWIAGFNDAELNRLVAEAITNNRDLMAASARVEQARALAVMNGAQVYPSVALSGVVGNTDTEVLRLGAVWELDFWGRVRSQARAAKSQYEASQSDYRWAEQSLAASVATAWFSLIEMNRIIERTEQSVAAQEGLLTIAKQRTKTGISAETDIEEADSKLRGMRSDLAAMQLSRTQAVQSLEILLGRYPADALRTTQDLPSLTPVPVDVPASLLERRPDLVAAEQRVAAAFDLKESADAARLPTISISAAITDISSDVFLINNDNSPISGGSLSFLAPLFSGGYLKAQAEFADAAQREAAFAYGSSALVALKEVESGLRAEASLAAQAKQQSDNLALQRELLRKEEVRVRVGSKDPRSVLQRKQSMLSTDIAYQQVRADQARQRVALLLALGGSWNVGPAAATP
jgi:NodT family efflux transporter outer membrane factor (OMF) lipoprotein